MTTRVVHVLDPVDSVYVGRANPRYRLGASRFANPYKIGRDGDRATCIASYRDDLYRYAHTPSDLLHLLPELRGKAISCWCRHDSETRTDDNECHADVLVEALNRYTDDELRAFGRGEMREGRAVA